MSLSVEMKANGWVELKDEETGCTFVYNKKFTDEFWKEEKSDKPLISTEIIMIDLNNEK